MAHVKRSFFGRSALAAAGLASVLMLTAGPSLRADDACQRRMAKADHKLHEAIEHQGAQSEQAEHWRHELHEARESCWRANHKWWDEDEHRWHSERDWDDHDHNH